MLLQKMESRGLHDIHFFAKGRRGCTYTAFLKNNKNKHVMIKAEIPRLETPSTISFETQWLQKMNKKKIGPKFFFAESNFLVMEFIDGILFLEYLEQKPKAVIQKVIKNLLQQMYILDQWGVNKKEMTHPHKHIIIRDDKPVLIDFERSKHTENPKNINQFVQFLTSLKVKLLLEKKDILIDQSQVLHLAKDYKEHRTIEKYQKIVEVITAS